MSNFITVEQLAKLLQVKPSTIRTWVREDKIPHFRFGRVIRFDVEDVKSWTAGNTKYNGKFKEQEAVAAAKDLEKADMPLFVS